MNMICHNRCLLAFLFLFLFSSCVLAQKEIVEIESIEPSWTLPIVEIETENHDSIKSKDYYIPASFVIRNNKYDRGEVLTIGIRGRGNTTWNDYEKKPYKLKFDKKINLVGGGKSKHYVLLCFADGPYAFWDNLVGFELSRRIGLQWTPSMIPVELILNGDYQGLYFIVENIRVEENRVNIKEQKNGETDDIGVSGGWLLEIDNTIQSNQIDIYDKENKVIRFTYHSPDSLSEEQFDYLTGFLNAANDAIMSDDYNSREWEKYIDTEELVKYYIVQELMDNPEGFAGSCWLSKEQGFDAKIKFGPVWDMGQSFVWREDPDFITNVVILGMRYKQSWLTELLNFPKFTNQVNSLWKTFHGKTNVSQLVAENVDKLKAASHQDHLRWPQYSDTYTEESSKNFLYRYSKKKQFLEEQWSNTNRIEADTEVGIIFDSNTVLFRSSSVVENVQFVFLNGITMPLSKVANNYYSFAGLKGVVCLLYQIDGKQYTRRVLALN